MSGADIDPERLGIERARSETPPQGEGKNRGDLWMQYGTGDKPALVAEWWWDGSEWEPIPVVMYLDQLSARDVQVDAAVIGLLCAGIIRSGSFTTADGLVGFDKSGFWAKDEDGNTLFKATGDGVHAVGGLQTASSGDRVQLSQTLIEGTKTGGLQGIGDDKTPPYWLIWGTHSDEFDRLSMGTSPQQPQFTAVASREGDSASMVAGRVNLAGGSINMYTSKVTVNELPAGFKDYNPSSYLGWSADYEDYNGATRLYKRAGVYFLELNIKVRTGVVPSQKIIPVVRLDPSIMPDHSLDVLAYGTSYAMGRFHVFGPGESQPQGTISIGTANTTANFFSGQMFWAEAR